MESSSVGGFVLTELVRQRGTLDTCRRPKPCGMAGFLASREENRVVWSLSNRDHKPILSAIKAELKRLGIDRPDIVAEWPDVRRLPGIARSAA